MEAAAMEEELDARLKAWGNSYGIVIPVDVARRMHLKPGETVHVRISYEPARNNAGLLPKWDLGGNYDIDAILDEELGKEHDT
jgi:hypothetical protein